jgi:sulfite exporter TauE/SafE
LHSHAIPAGGDLLLLFFASLFGSAHCVGMCGPYVALCAARISPIGPSGGVRVLLRLLFNAGRLAAYVAVGLLAGGLGQIAFAAGDRAGLRGAVSLAAGLAAFLFGLVLLGRARDPALLLRKSGLDALIRDGARSAFRAPPYVAAALLGSLQGAFPCALVYGAASRAAAAGSAGAGAATMLVFGLGTVPAIFAMSSISPRLMARLPVRRWAGALIGLVGLLLVLRGLASFGRVPHTIFW